MSKKILMVVSNPAVSTTLGGPVGFWASELVHPYDAFRRRGYEVTVASPGGGRVVPDAMSDPRDESGYSADDALSRLSSDVEDLRAEYERSEAVPGDLMGEISRTAAESQKQRDGHAQGCHFRHSHECPPRMDRSHYFLFPLRSSLSTRSVKSYAGFAYTSPPALPSNM